jgi:hypothetical protein
MTKKVCLLATVAFAGSANAQLLNGSFESPINFDGNSAGNWTAFFSGGADFQMAEPVDPTGDPSFPTSAPDGSLVLQIGTVNAINKFVGVVQNVGGVVAGEEFTLSLEARQIVQDGIDLEFRIEWLDADGGFVGDQFAFNQNITDSLTTDFQVFSLTAVAPTNAVAANIVIAGQTFTSFAPFTGFVQVDAVSFVPAPGVAAAFGVVGLGAARRRR